MSSPIQLVSEEAPCIPRECRRCERTYLITLTEADKVPPESIVNLCGHCMTAVFVDREDYPELDEVFSSA